MTFEFNTQLRRGQLGEKMFFEAHKGFLEQSPTLAVDFIVTRTGEGVELKTDSYNMEKTANFFFERYSDMEKKSPGGPWQSLEKGAEIFCYFFPSNLIYFRFDTAELVQRLDDIICEYKPREIKNPTYTTLGYCVPREKLADIYKETRLNVSFHGGTF